LLSRSDDVHISPTTSDTPSGDGTRSTRQALLAAGLVTFARAGYDGARVADISAEAGMTTGALYGHFDGKEALFTELFRLYGDEITRALHDAHSLEGQLVQVIEVSRKYRGALRASAGILQRRPDHAAVRRGLRETCAGLLAWHLREPLTQRDARLVGRTLIDILDQYTLVESMGWIKHRDPTDVASALHSMVMEGVYVQ
jgi:AcrR family transcriptional regulator